MTDQKLIGDIAYTSSLNSDAHKWVNLQKNLS